MQDVVTNLRWRGMIHQITPGTEAQLQTEKTSVYIGFDPTAPSLHIGNLATIMLLKHFQLAGHRPVIVVGGATGMVGDPSGKSSERKFLSEEVLRHNQARISHQLQRLLDFSDQKNNGGILLNNLAWFQEMRFLQFLREVGKHISVNYMMAKDAVKQRLASGISFTEFAYQLLQSYDFYYLYNHHNVRLQLGGSDQWGNLTSGIEFIRRKVGDTAFALTIPLITKPDGTKFGKTEKGPIWLDPSMTSPYAFYQFWINRSDQEARKLIKVFTLLDQATIQEYIQTHDATPHARVLQKIMAEELTTMIHGERAYRQAAQAAEILFSSVTTQEDLQRLSEHALLSVLSNVPRITISKELWENVADVTNLVSSATQGVIFESKGQARRTILEGGLSINKVRVTDPRHKPSYSRLRDKYILVQKGKRHHYLIIVQ